MSSNFFDYTLMLRRHRYYLRTGFYTFLLKNTVKVIEALLAIVVIFLVLEKWVIDLDTLFDSLFHNLSDWLVFVVFTLSESVFGLIPPDFFIIWPRKFDNPWLIVWLLAFLSYLGGIISYGWGKWVGTIPKIKNFISVRFKIHVVKLRRWGAVFIVVAALFPIPYSVVCVLSGMLNFPFKLFLLLGFFRIARFFAYGVVLFGLLN